MRLVAERTQQDAGADGAFIHQQCEAAEQRRGEECVLPQAECPEYRGEGEQRRQPAGAMLTQDAAHRDYEQPEGAHLEHGEGDHVRHRSEPGAQDQIDWRIEEVLVRRARVRCLLLGEVVRGLVIGELRRSSERQFAGGVEADEIRCRRRMDRNEHAVLP